jgi:hypothetical protein
VKPKTLSLMRMPHERSSSVNETDSPTAQAEPTHTRAPGAMLDAAPPLLPPFFATARLIDISAQRDNPAAGNFFWLRGARAGISDDKSACTSMERRLDVVLLSAARLHFQQRGAVQQIFIPRVLTHRRAIHHCHCNHHIHACIARTRHSERRPKAC